MSDRSSPSKGVPAMPPSSSSSQGAGAGNPSSSVPPSSSSSSQGAGAGKALPAEDFNYGSVVDVIARMGLTLTVDPSSMLNMEAELPAWLRPAPENTLVKMEPFAADDPKFPAHDPSRATFWIKVSSAAAFLDAVAASAAEETQEDLHQQPPAVYIYVMPTIPLRDAHQIEQMLLQQEDKAAVNIINPDLLSTKVATFKDATKTISYFASNKQAVQARLGGLQEFAQARIEHAHDMRVRFENAKADLDKVPAKDKVGTCQQHQDMLTAASVHLLTRDVASVARIAHESMEGLDVSLADTVAKLEAAMTNPTFMGCAPPPLPPPDAGGDAAN